MRETASGRRQAPLNVTSSLDAARELGIRDAQAMSGPLSAAYPVMRVRLRTPARQTSGRGRGRATVGPPSLGGAHQGSGMWVVYQFEY